MSPIAAFETMLALFELPVVMLLIHELRRGPRHLGAPPRIRTGDGKRPVAAAVR